VARAFCRERDHPDPELAPTDGEQEGASAAPREESSKWKLRRPLSVIFAGEDGQGAGVRREFFQVAIRAFLQELFDQSLGRMCWFGDADRPDAYFACGALMGQAVLHDVLLPCAFPWPLYDLLLRDLGSPHSSCSRHPGVDLSGPEDIRRTILSLCKKNSVKLKTTFEDNCQHVAGQNSHVTQELRSVPEPLPGAAGGATLAHLEAVSPAEAASLRKVLDYQQDDIAEHFGTLGWERVGDRLKELEFSQATKHEFVQAYVHWSFEERIAHQIGPLSAGFQSVLGGSVMIQRMFDANQLERIMCGGEVPVDIEAIRRRAITQGWSDDDQPYLDVFWHSLSALDEELKRGFLGFVTSSDREPLRGWEELRITVQKNGKGDDRLPTAYTCFSLLLLPKYSSDEVLRKNLTQAMQNSEGFGLQ